jgi:hypothetical protein
MTSLSFKGRVRAGLAHHAWVYLTEGIDMRRYVSTFMLRLAVASLLALAGWTVAQAAPVCPETTKDAAAADIAALDGMSDSERTAAEASIYQQYSSCLQDASLTPTTDPFYTAVRQCGTNASHLGSIYFEEMPCCGYDPQRRQFGCPVKIKQRFGFGGAPLPGSREYVLNCVADNNNVLQPVALDSVHLANEMFAKVPPWQFAVIASANQNLHTVQPMNGVTRNARSILSWGLRPTGCNYLPIWGNVINYRIRLDQ